MDSNAGIDCHTTENLVALDRVAALCQLIDYVVYTLVYYQRIGRRLLCLLWILAAGTLCRSLSCTALLICLAREPAVQ